MKRSRLAMLLLIIAILLGQGLFAPTTQNRDGDATVASHDTAVVEAGFGGGFLQRFFSWLWAQLGVSHGGDGCGGSGDGSPGSGGGPGSGDGSPGSGGGPGSGCGPISGGGGPGSGDGGPGTGGGGPG